MAWHGMGGLGGIWGGRDAFTQYIGFRKPKVGSIIYLQPYSYATIDKD